MASDSSPSFAAACPLTISQRALDKFLYVGLKGSSTLAAIRRAASGKDGADVTVAERIHADYKKRKLLSPFSVWRVLQAQPVFASVRYGGRSIIKNLPIPPGLNVIGWRVGRWGKRRPSAQRPDVGTAPRGRRPRRADGGE